MCEPYKTNDCFVEIWYIQVRGMLFAKDVRKQLSQIMQKVAKGQQQKHIFSNICFNFSDYKMDAQFNGSVCLIITETGGLDIKRKERRRDREENYKNLRKALCVGYASQLAERMIRHNGYRTLGFKSQLVQVK